MVHLSQGRFKSLVVRVEEYFLSCAGYIERDPVRVDLVTEQGMYRGSSCRTYALEQTDPAAPMLHYNLRYRSLVATAQERQGRWRTFLLADDPHAEDIRQEDLVEGDAAKRRRMQREGARPGRRRGRPLKAPHNQEGYFPQFYESAEDA